MTLFNKIILLTVFLGASLNSNAIFRNDSNEKYYSKFKEVFERVERDYVKEPKKQELIDAAIEGMLSSLDPHSGFFADDDLEFFVTNTKGEFGGIGIEIVFENGAVKVISPIDDLPAYKAGIKPGDYIIKVNNDLVTNLGYNKALLELRGEPGSKVKISVIREGETKPLEFELVREIVKINSVKSSLDHNIAYIRISTFSEKVLEELKKAITNLQNDNKDKIQGIILDLRNNPGGLLTPGVNVANYFIDEGIIVSTRGRDKSSEVIFKASPESEKAPKLPMVVLINGGSASASEIVAAALQENGRAIVMGTKSYGKGSVQTFLPLDERSAYKFTTALYYTPKGISIQAEGITPDVLVENAKVEYSKKDDDGFKISESSLKNHIKNEKKSDNQDNKSNKTSKNNIESKIEKTDSKKEPAKMSETYMKDFQYARAFDLLQGIIIFDKTKNERKK